MNQIKGGDAAASTLEPMGSANLQCPWSFPCLRRASISAKLRLISRDKSDTGHSSRPPATVLNSPSRCFCCCFLPAASDPSRSALALSLRAAHCAPALGPEIIMSSFSHYLLRCTPALSAVATLLLTAAAFTDFPAFLFPCSNPIARREAAASSWTITQAVWCFYVLLLHWLTWHYNVRLCWAMFTVTGHIREAAESTQQLNEKVRPDFTACEKIAPLAQHAPLQAGAEQQLMDDSIIHVIMLPAYREDVDTLEETLDVFASHTRAKTTYYVYLAMEEKDPNAVPVATALLARYAGRFRDIVYTVHPADLAGEAPGKSSNVSWAAKHAMERFSNSPMRQNTILTVMDADTHLLSTYFDLVNRLHLAAPDDAAHTIFAPPMVFDRNSHKVPAFVRMTDLLWSSATMSGLFPGSVIGTPTSVYSVPLPLVERVQGWDADPGAIGEDLHMMVKCFFRTCGTLKVKGVYSPASQCNVCSNLSGFRGYIDSLHARWRQAIRHMWGSLDTGYAYERGLELVTEARSCAREAHDNKKYMGLPYSEPKRHERPILTMHSFFAKFVPLYHRLFEAHIMPLHITFAMLASTGYTFLTPSVGTPFLLLYAFNITGWMRVIAFLNMVLALVLYERYHALCITLREQAIRQAGLRYDSDSFSKRDSWHYALDYVLFPVGGMIFGSAPAIVAQVCHFWTDRLVYHVSAKPKRIIIDKGVVVEVDADTASEKLIEVDQV